MRLAPFLVVLAACPEPPHAPPPASVIAVEPPDAILNCAHAIGEVDTPPEPFQIIGGVVAVERKAYLGSTDPQYGDLFSKSALLIRKGAVFDLMVKDRTAVRVRWGNRDTPIAALRVPGCTSRAREWIVFAGGYWKREAGCVDLIVRDHGVDTVAHVGVGAECK